MAKNTYSYEFQLSEKLNEQIGDLLSKLPMFCSEYIHDKRAVNKFQPRTYEAYLRDIYGFFRYLCTEHASFKGLSAEKIEAFMLNELTRKDIVHYLSYISSYVADEKIHENKELGKARKLASLRSLFSYLVGEGILSFNPAADVDTPSKRRSDVVFLTSQQQETLLTALDNGKACVSNDTRIKQYKADNKILIRDTAIIYLLLGTGIRVSELVGLNLDDVDFRDCTIFVNRKGGKSQTLYFSSDVEDKLLAYLDYSRPLLLSTDGERESDEQALFLSTQKKRMVVRSVEKMLDKYTTYVFGAKPEKRITPHKLRSSYATAALQETDNVALVADALGHEGLDVVSRYAKVQDRKRAAINVRR